MASTLLGLIAPVAAGDQEWTRFRGPNGCGVGQASQIPDTWTEKDYNWKIQLPGKGFSSPVIWDDRLYVTSTIEESATFVTLCLNTTGRARREDVHRSGASELQKRKRQIERRLADAESHRDGAKLHCRGLSRAETEIG